MEGHIILTYKPRDFFEERILLVLMRQFRTPQSTAKRPFLRQEWLAEWVGTHQELISRWQRYVREGGLQKLKGEYENRVLTPEMCQAILEIWLPNFWLSVDQVRQRLLAEGHVARIEDVSLKSIYQVAQMPDAQHIFDFLERHYPKHVLSLPKGWPTPWRIPSSR